MTNDPKNEIPPIFADHKPAEPARVEMNIISPRERHGFGWPRGFPGLRGQEMSMPYDPALSTIPTPTIEGGEALPRGGTIQNLPPRNHVDELAEYEYAPDVVPADRLPSPGAALRQLCRSIDAHPNLKRLIEDHLAKVNADAQGQYRTTEELKTELVYAQDEVTGLSEENTRLGIQATNLARQVTELRNELRNLRLAQGSAEDQLALTPEHRDELGKAAREVFLSLTLPPGEAAITWEALADTTRAAWMAAAVRAVLGRALALNAVADGWAER